jgi:hypothetical protein
MPLNGATARRSLCLSYSISLECTCMVLLEGGGESLPRRTRRAALRLQNVRELTGGSGLAHERLFRRLAPVQALAGGGAVQRHKRAAPSAEKRPEAFFGERAPGRGAAQPQNGAATRRGRDQYIQ